MSDNSSKLVFTKVTPATTITNLLNVLVKWGVVLQKVLDATYTTSWTAVVFENSWTNYGAGYSNAEYRKVGTDKVEIRGVVAGGLVGSTQVFTLPEGYRPGATYMFGGYSDLGIAKLEVQTTGKVVIATGGNGFSTLAGIQFSIK